MKGAYVFDLEVVQADEDGDHQADDEQEETQQPIWQHDDVVSRLAGHKTRYKGRCKASRGSLPHALTICELQLASLGARRRKDGKREEQQPSGIRSAVQDVELTKIQPAVPLTE